MQRRRLIMAATVAVVPPVTQAAPQKRMKPQVGDILVHAFGERSGQAIEPADVGEARIFAFPRSLDGVVRDGSIHNQVCVLRLDPEAMSDRTRGYSAGPFLAVSAVCTHTGCEISGWHPNTGELECPCHGSRFDVANAARVANGPATNPLAFLPIDLTNGAFRVAGGFSRRVGPAPAY